MAYIVTHYSRAEAQVTRSSDLAAAARGLPIRAHYLYNAAALQKQLPSIHSSHKESQASAKLMAFGIVLLLQALKY